MPRQSVEKFKEYNQFVYPPLLSNKTSSSECDDMIAFNGSPRPLGIVLGRNFLKKKRNTNKISAYVYKDIF